MEEEIRGVQSFRVGIAGFLLHLLIGGVMVFGSFLILEGRITSLPKAIEVGEWLSISWSLLVIFLVSLFGLLMFWTVLSQLSLKIEVAPQELRLISILPLFPNLILARRKKAPYGSFVSVPWNEVQKIDYVATESSGSLVIVNGDPRPISLDYASTFYPLKKLLLAIHLYVPLSKFSEDARKLIVGKPDKTTDPLRLNQDQMELLSLKELKKLRDSNPSDTQIQRALFFRYLSKDAYIKKKYSQEVLALGKELLNVSPRDERLLVGMGNVYLWFNDDKATAIAQYEAALEINQKNGLIYKKLLAAYCLDRRFQDAKKLLSRYKSQGLRFISETDLAFIQKVISSSAFDKLEEDGLNVYGSDDWPDG